jgi:hypothetical protein
MLQYARGLFSKLMTIYVNKLSAFKILLKYYDGIKIRFKYLSYILSICLSGLVTAVAVFRNPNTIPFCLTTDVF